MLRTAFILPLAMVAAGAASPAAAIAIFETAPTVARPGLDGAQPVRVQSGSRNGINWTAASRIIGQLPTSDVLPPDNSVGGGSPIYKPSSSKSGVVALIMEINEGLFICSGSLLAGGRHIATAAHCVAGTDGQRNAINTTAYFFNGDPDSRTPFQISGVSKTVSDYFIHPEYTGEVIDQNDIAVLRLYSAAPQGFERYDLFTPAGLTGAEFNVAGYGGRSTVGGDVGTSGDAGARTGFLREGDNRFDYAWGDSRFENFFTEVIGGTNFFGTAEVEFSYISDFDNGTADQDAARRIANALGLGPLGNQFFTDTGLGEREVAVAGGDSGGPGFINGQLASINSYGLSFGTDFGDILPGLNTSFGEFSGYVPVYIHADFITSAATIPEPSSWAMLIAGFGLIGAARRRRRTELHIV